MNIFVLDRDPTTAAQMLCDKHVVKMVLESAQMLSTVAHQKGLEAPYRMTHRNHPCTVWAGSSEGNWLWLVEHALAMCAEYTHRYGRTHKSQAVIEWCRDNKPDFSSSEATAFAQAMPDRYKDKCPVAAYRSYYHGEKSAFAKWSRRSTPKWFVSSAQSWVDPMNKETA